MEAMKFRCQGCGKFVTKQMHEGWMRFLSRKYCTKDCANKLKGVRTRTKRHEEREAARQRRDAQSAPWPYVTGEIETSFHRFNHDPGDAQHGRLVLRPATFVATRSSADF